jgi:hypothetical protein
LNHAGHVAGGIVAGSLVCFLAYSTGDVKIGFEVLNEISDSPFSPTENTKTLFGLFATALFMALFPDLDIQSITQRWFYRAVFVLLGIMHFTGRHDLFVVISFCAVLPVLHQHRGWTHWKITPWVIAIFLATVQEYFHAQQRNYGSFEWVKVLGLLEQYWLFVIACVTGHYVHLILDARSMRWLKFISNDSNHH